MGFYANVIASTGCKVCPNGYYSCDPTILPIQCPVSTYSSSPGGITECKSCSLGYYANVTASTGCKVCPNGYYSCDTTKEPVPCPLGSFSSSNGGISECKKCSNGTYTTQIASTGCKLCPNSQCPTYSNPPSCYLMPVQVPKCSPNDYELDNDKFKCESCDYRNRLLSRPWS